uniref:Uncharacterized protein n=1 Tax=Strigamia maritima TaxID=126957 RepID=T1JIM9_STRMM
MAAPESRLSVEVQFAQKLAANEKTLRDRALKRLRKWIRVRSARKNGFKKDEMLKLWKGLFYCMWMSDKPLVQEDLATSITIYFGKVISAIFQYLSNNDWDFVLLKKLIRVMQTVVIKEHNTFKGFPLSLQLHLAEIYIEEFAKIATNELSDEVKLKVIEPYCKLIVVTKNNSLRDRIADKVFKLIMKISNVDLPESKTEIPSSEDEEIFEEEEEEEEKSEDEEEIEVAPKRKRKNRKSKIKKHSYRHMFIQNERRDLNLPFIDVNKFDYTAIAETLIKLASAKGVYDKNRSTAYDLAKKFRSLADGVYPLFINMPEYDGSDLEESDLEDALVKYQKEIEGRKPDVRRKRLKKKQKTT